MSDLLTVQEAAAYLCLPVQTVYSAIQDGRLHTMTVLGRKVLARAELDCVTFGRNAKRRKGAGRKKRTGTHPDLD